MIHITSLKDLDAIIEANEKIKQPRVINFYGTEVTFRKTNAFLRNLGSSGIITVDLNAKERGNVGYYPVFADVIKYGGYVFNLIYVNKIIEQSINEIT